MLSYIKVNDIFDELIEENQKLKECLNIDMGTAILILQYAKEDVQAITDGKLFIQSHL